MIRRLATPFVRHGVRTGVFRASALFVPLCHQRSPVLLQRRHATTAPKAAKPVPKVHTMSVGDARDFIESYCGKCQVTFHDVTGKQLRDGEFHDAVTAKIHCTRDAAKRLFALPHHSGSKLVKELQKHVAWAGRYCSVPMTVLFFGHLAHSWPRLTKMAQQVNNVVEIINNRRIRNKEAVQLNLCVAIGGDKSRAAFFSIIYDIVQRLNTAYNVPLAKLMETQPDNAVELLKQCVASGRFLERREYLSRAADWGPMADDLPKHYLLPDSDLTLSRDGMDVLAYLAPTEAVKDVMRHKGKTVIVINGESGSGKTCALLAAGGTTNDVHIAMTAAYFLGGVDINTSVDEMAEYVDKEVVKYLLPALQKTKGNDTKPLRVMLHLDEAGVEDIIPKLRSLIKCAGTLRKKHTAHLNDMKVSLRISIALAGTGLAMLYSGAVGSIAGQYHVYDAKPPKDAVTLRSIVLAHLPNNMVGSDAIADAVLSRDEVTQLVGTNMRLLSFTLRAFVKALNAVSTTAGARNKDPLFNAYMALCKKKKVLGVKPADPTTVVGAILRYACVQAVTDFVNCNGLCSLSRDMREALLRVAHVAYLKRAVFIRGGAADQPSLQKEAERAGFTPLLWDNDTSKQKGKNNQTVEVEMLQRGTKLGVFTTTEQELRDTVPKDRIRTSSWYSKDSSKRYVTSVPRGAPPMVMSRAYRLLSRIHSGNLFNDSPGAFEHLVAEMVFEALQCLAVVEGGCTYRTLVAAVAGPSYGLATLDQHCAKAKDLPFDWLSFTRVVRVALPTRLNMFKNYMIDVAVACAEALQRDAPNHKLAAALNTAKKDGVLKDDVRKKLLPQLAGCVFVLVPKGGSPSADILVLCFDATGRFGHLLQIQVKRNELIDIADGKFAEELNKMKPTSNSTVKSLLELTGATVTDCFFALFKDQANKTAKYRGNVRVHTYVVTI